MENPNQKEYLEIQKQREDEYKAYKSREREKPDSGKSEKENIEWKIKQAEDVIKMRKEWDDKFQPNRHREEIDNWTKRLENLKNKRDKSKQEKSK